MNDASSKSNVFAALQTLSAVIPNMRTGQLVAAVGEMCDDMYGRGLWDAEDREFLEAIWQFQRNLELSAVGSTQEQANSNHDEVRTRV